MISEEVIIQREDARMVKRHSYAVEILSPKDMPFGEQKKHDKLYDALFAIIGDIGDVLDRGPHVVEIQSEVLEDSEDWYKVSVTISVEEMPAVYRAAENEGKREP